MRLVLLLFVLAAAAGCVRDKAKLSVGPGPSPSGPEWPGKQADGSVLLPNQWSLRPAGRQVDLGDFPVNVAVHPDGRYAAVLHSGYSQHEIVVVDLSSATIASRTRIAESFYGLAFTKDGRHLYCSGAGDEVVHGFAFAEGKLSHPTLIRLRDAARRGVPAGLALDAAGRRLFAANLRGNSVSFVSLAEARPVTEVAFGTNTQVSAAPLVKPSTDLDVAAAEKRAQADLQPQDAGENFPYACQLDEKRRRLYVSLWASRAVAVVDIDAAKVVATWPTGQHPCEMALTRSGKFLFVANANENTVTVIDTDLGKAVETILASLYPGSPPGSTPNSLALSRDETRLFVANACNNIIAVFDVSHPGRSRSLGFIPAGWYPTSVRVTPDGKRLLIANGKGVVPKANPLGPQPGATDRRTSTAQYIAQLLTGTLAIVDLPAERQFEARMKEWTAQAYACSPLRPDAGVTGVRPEGNPVPLRPGGPSPIKYCIYIVKENRTYDQVLGDMPEGNGDPKLCLFPERVTPNHHQLAREFLLLDNFYVESEVSADGHEWSMGAYATDFVEKLWPLGYGHGRSGKFTYVAEGNFGIATPAGGYLWDRAKEAGVSYRSYGEFIANREGNRPPRARSRNLVGHFDESYQGFDLGYSDQKRADRFISELRRFEAEGDMPRLQIVRLPNDHTHGATPGFPTPTAYVADNDLALGRVVDAVSHSKFWPQTAVFVVEDDAQNGPDHVDAHRTVAFVLSPYTRRAGVDSTMYSTTSMLRTIELILGLKPMSQFDAAARPMFASFRQTPDLAPYTALPARVDLRALNGTHAWGGRYKMNFAQEDAADDLLLNEVVWRSVRGAESPMPAPVRAGFVFPHPEED